MSITTFTETAGGFRHIIQIDAHTLAVDMNVASGGTETAPDPHDYFDASLAACKALTAVVYAKARKMALDKVVVHVTRDATQERAGTYVLKVSASFEGALSNEEKAKLHDVLSRCPIHKLMTTATIDIQTEPFQPSLA